MLAAGTQDAEALVTAAQQAADRHRWLDALDLASQALAIDPHRLEAAALVGQARDRLGALSAAGAELRQLTVLALDMVGSTAVAARIGPERMRELMLAVYEVCAAVVTRLEGRITNYSGDGVMAQFGHPIAHEDDPRRAVLAGWEVLEQIRRRHPEFESRFGQAIELRAGIDTGLVAVGPVLATPFSPEDLVGDPPNVASRVQAVAAPMSLVLTAATRELVADWFETEAVGSVELRNYPRPVDLHRVLRPREEGPPVEAATRARSELVGREAELAVLRAVWQEVSGRGGTRLLTITGEPGIGKSRLVAHLLAMTAATGAQHLTLGCAAVYRDSPLRPVAQALRRFFRVFPDESIPETMWLEAIGHRLERVQGRTVPTEVAVPILARLLGLRPVADMEPEHLRRVGFEVVVDLLAALARESALVLVLEDAHVADPSTLEMVGALTARRELRLLVAATSRGPVPALPAADHSLELAPLEASAARRLAASANPRLDEPTLAAVVERCAGLPFYIEEVARGGGELGRLPEAALVSLRGFLGARLDELGQPLKDVLWPVALAGREVSVTLVGAFAGLQGDESRRRLEELVRRRVVTLREGPNGGRVQIRHALLAGAALDSILDSRRGQLHRRMAELMSSGEHGQFAPEEVAAHRVRGGDMDGAAELWVAAAEQAAAGAASSEALELFDHALRSLEEAGGAERRPDLELAIRLGQGALLAGLEGYTAPRARSAFERAAELAERLADSAALMPALWGLWAYWLVLAEHHIAGGLGRRCARIASEHPGDEQVQMMALAVNGFQALVLGEFARAADELEQVWRMEGVEPHQVFPHDPVSTALATHAVAAWFVGEAELARALAARAERMLEQLDPGHRRTALTRASVGAYLAWHAALDGDPYRSLALAEQAAAVATERQYPTWAAANLLHRAIALCHLERHQEGLPALEMLVAQWRAAGADATGRQLHPILLTPYFSGRLAETYLDVGEPAAAQRQLDQALRESASSGEAFWDAELLRLRAVARAASGDATGAADDLSAAQVVAARQGAGALEQRVDATASRT